MSRVNIDKICKVLNLDLASGVEIWEASGLLEHRPTVDRGIVVLDLDVINVRKLVRHLLHYYPHEHQVEIVLSYPDTGEEKGAHDGIKPMSVSLIALDKLPIDNAAALFIPPLARLLTSYPLDPLMDVVKELRGEHGCPWDKEQTHMTLRRYLIEEAWEVVEAIEEGKMNKLQEELGDLLLQIGLHAVMAKEAGAFDMNDIIKGITAKMIYRHPHVFGDVTVENSAEVRANWEELKARERGDEKPHSLMSEVTASLPSLMYACKIQKKASGVGFDWDEPRGALHKLFEEIRELWAAYRKGNSMVSVEEEVGDAIFALVNVARLLNVEPEIALRRTIRKFIKRFQFMESAAQASGTELSRLSLDEKEKLWQEAKNLL